ncbi:hypothetical protein LTS15_010451 [Exophiala xenobiotica]|nr:hypothetical protein LTS15_010451 [Exophiala xenobiotica]
MEEAKTLIRTAVRTFFNQPRQILIVDALMLHSVLGMDDLSVLLSAQPKDIRSIMGPLRVARLVQTHSRMEVRVGSQRGSPREYYYCPFHPAIDAIKYRIAKLRKKVEALYQQDETKRKDWRCPRCKAEYEELEILDKIGDEGFYCDRCGATLVQNPRAAEEKGNHEKIRRLNDQLKKFDDMILKIDRKDIPENDFQSAWDRKKDVPRERGGKEHGQYIELKRGNQNLKKGPEMVKVENLAVNLTSGAQQAREEAEREEERKRLLAKQNQLPAWHTNSAIGPINGAAAGVKVEAAAEADGVMPKKEEGEEEDEKKPDLVTTTTTTTASSILQDEVAAYMAEMERERLEAEKLAKEEDEEEEEEDEDFEFEDVDVAGASNVGTPAAAMDMKPANGLKREFDEESGPSSDANTPASFAGADGSGRDSKRVKFENGTSLAAARLKTEQPGTSVVKTEADGDGDGDGDSDEDEDFEDAI